MGEFLPLIIAVVIAAILCAAMVTLSWLLGPKKVTPYKESPYECGVAPSGDAQQRFPIKFYLTGILFVLFDIEVVFLWSWLTVFRNAPDDFMIFSGIAMAVYFALWILGDWYVLKVGAIDWDDEPIIAEEKLLSSSPVDAPATPAAAPAYLEGATR